MNYGGSEPTETWTVGGRVTCGLRTGNQGSSVQMYICKASWRKLTETKSCSDTWRIIIGQECMCAKREWKFSKESYRRPGRGRKGQIHSASWLKPPSLIIVLISLDLASKCENFEDFGAFWKFLVKLQVFPMEWSHPGWDHFEGLLGILKTWHFWKGNAKRKITNTWEKPDFEIWASKSSKIHQKNDFLPTFWVAESDLGRNGFWGVKSAPNSEIPLGMESRQAKLSNEPSCTWFWSVEPTQKQLWRCATKTSGGATKSSSFARIDLFGQKNVVLTMVDYFYL